MSADNAVYVYQQDSRYGADGAPIPPRIYVDHKTSFDPSWLTVDELDEAFVQGEVFERDQFDQAVARAQEIVGTLDICEYGVQTISSYDACPSTLHRALRRVEMEREYQDRRWGGAEHDQQHRGFDWVAFTVDYLGRASRAAERGDHFEFQRQMIKVAALAVAAVQSSEQHEKTESMSPA